MLEEDTVIKNLRVVENGEVKEYDVLFTLKDEKKNKKFVIYTDMNSDIDIYAALYNEKENKIEYIDNPDDQVMIDEIIKIVRESSK